MAEIKIVAEMAGRILSVTVSEGDDVEPGQEIALIESMKMEIPLTSPVRGTIAGILRQPDDMVNEGDPLFVVRGG